MEWVRGGVDGIAGHESLEYVLMKRGGEETRDERINE